jgi:hypothetical protein
MGSPFGEFDGTSGGADAVMDDEANPDVLNNALGTGVSIIPLYFFVSFGLAFDASY